jgi:hypothetical protein
MTPEVLDMRLKVNDVKTTCPKCSKDMSKRVDYFWHHARVSLICNECKIVNKYDLDTM